jgi:hypothetical protein
MKPVNDSEFMRNLKNTTWSIYRYPHQYKFQALVPETASAPRRFSIEMP